MTTTRSILHIIWITSKASGEAYRVGWLLLAKPWCQRLIKRPASEAEHAAIVFAERPAAWMLSSVALHVHPRALRFVVVLARGLAVEGKERARVAGDGIA